MRSIYAVIAVSVLALGCGKLGVSRSSGGGSTSAGATAIAPEADPTPKVRFTSPARGSFLATGRVAIEGQVTAVGTATADVVTTATVNGAPVTLDSNGTFRTFVDVVDGLNMIEAVCRDSRNRTGSTVIGVLGGTYKPAGLPIARAAMARVNDPAIDAIGKIAESALWATDWTTLFQGLNPIYDASFLWISVELNITQVRFRDLHAALDSRPSGISTTLTLDEPIIDCTVEADLGLGVIVGPYPAVARADTGRITGVLNAAPGQGGIILTNIGGHSVTFQNFAFNVQHGLLDAAVQLLAKNAIQNALIGFIEDALDTKVCPLMDKGLAEILQQQTPFDILGKKFALDVRAESIVFDNQGFSLAIAFNAVGNNGIPLGAAASAPGSLVTAGNGPASATTRGFLISLDDDAVNRALYGLWAGGIMDVVLDEQFLTTNNINLPIKLEAGSLRRFLPEIGGRVPDSAPARVHLHAELPPCVKVTGSPDIAVGQAGEVFLDIDVDRGNGYERLLSAVAQVEVGANLELTNQGLHITSLSQPRFRFDLVDEPMVELDDRRLEVLLSVVMTPLVPHFMNASNVIWIPHLSQLQTVNVDLFADGPAREHVSVTGDLLR